MSKEKEKKLQVEKNVELRILIIGEIGVGKKSITKRFKLLNCTETKDNYFSLKKSETNEEKKTSNVSFLLNNELDETTEGEINGQKKENQRLSLMNFSKIYKIDTNSIEITFYPCAESEPLSLDYNPDDDDDDKSMFETMNKISLKKLNYEIAQIIIKPLSNHHNHLEILFFFCFDLSNIKSFEQLKLYYSQIEQNFDLKNNYHSILVGNKLDKKNNDIVFEKNIYKFLEQTSLKYYEISTFMFFNFETFFENIFFRIFEGFQNFSNKSFKTNFHNVLSQKSTFLQSERKVYETNLNPSPNKYKNNPYEYPSRNKELLKIFKKKEKYNKSIFINKEGPVFPPLPKKNIFKDDSNRTEISLDNKKENEKEDNVFDNKIKNDIFTNEYNITKVDLIKENSPIIWDTQRQNEIKDILNPTSKKKGCSLGILYKNSSRLRNERREKKMKINLKINTAFDNGFNLSRRNKSKLKDELSQEKYEKSKNDIYKKKLEEVKKTEYEIKERHKRIIKLNNNIIQEKINFFKEKDQKYIKKFIKKQKEKIAKQKKAQRLNILNSSPKKKDSITSNFNLYNITANISKDRGFSFGQKLPVKIKVDSPDFPNFLDDFEKILIRNTKKQNINIKGAERFQRAKSDIYEDLSNHKLINKQQKIFESKRKKFIKNKLSDFFKDRKNKKEIVKRNKINLIKDEQKEFNYQLIKQYKTANDYFSREINYNLVENSSPKYTIKGKYQYHPSLSYQSYYGSSDDIFNPYENDGNYNEYKEKNKYKKKVLLSEVPNFNIGKPKYPAYSFGSSERFNNNKNKYNSLSLDNELFKDGNFGYQDTKSFLKTQNMMGTEKKFRCYKDNGVPGPGNYVIRNFAEEISSKGESLSAANFKGSDSHYREVHIKNRSDAL